MPLELGGPSQGQESTSSLRRMTSKSSALNPQRALCYYYVYKHVITCNSSCVVSLRILKLYQCCLYNAGFCLSAAEMEQSFGQLPSWCRLFCNHCAIMQLSMCKCFRTCCAMDCVSVVQMFCIDGQFNEEEIAKVLQQTMHQDYLSSVGRHIW